MDEKTRTNFNLNIWNPGAVARMEENQIYETCNDFLDGAGTGTGGAANHYCTPVSTRQTSRASPNRPMRTTISRKSLANKCHGPSNKCLLVSSFLLLFLLLIVAIGCCAYAILEILKLKDEVRNLKGIQRDDTASLNSSIIANRELHCTRLLELDSKIERVSTDLTQQVEENVSLLQSDLQNGLGFLSEDVRDNLTLLANLSSLNLMELVDDVASNLTSLANQLEQQDIKMETQLEEIQNTVNNNISLLATQTGYALQELDSQIGEVLDELNSTLTREIKVVALSVDSLERSTDAMVAQLSATEKGDFELLFNTHESDTRNLESLIATNHDTILMSITRSGEEDQDAIAQLRSEVHRNISALENSTADSFLLLAVELDKVEAELSLEAHGNISQLNSNIQQQLDDITSFTLRNVSNLEAETRNALTHITTQTEERFTDIESRVRSELSSLNQSIDLLSLSVEDTLESLDQLHAYFQGGLEEVSTTAYQNISLLAVSTNVSIEQLENNTEISLLELVSAVNETREQLENIRLEVTRNFTNIGKVFEEERAELRTEFEASVDALNSSTSQYLTDLSCLLNNSIADTLEMLDATENVLGSRISSEVSDLRGLLEAYEGNVTSELQRTDLLLQEHITSSSGSFQSLEDGIRNLETENYMNITRSNDELTDRVSELVFSLNRSIVESREDLGSGLTRLEMDVVAMLDIVNASLHWEIQSLSSTTAISISSLADNISRQLIDVYHFVNDNLTEIELQFNATLYDVQMSLNTTNSDIASSGINLLSLLNDTTTNLTLLLESRFVALQSSVDQVAEGVSTNITLIRQSLTSLDAETHTNITRVEDQVLFVLENVENETQADLDVLRSDQETLRDTVHDNLSAVTSMFNGALLDLNVSVSDTLEAFQMDYQNGLSEVVQATNLSFMGISTEVIQLTNATMSLWELAGDLDSQQDLTTVSINSLESAIRNLSLVLEETRHNVSAVTNGVEQLDGQLQTHLESPVDLFSECVEETANCTYTPEDTQFQDGCDTDALLLNWWTQCEVGWMRWGGGEGGEGRGGKGGGGREGGGRERGGKGRGREGKGKGRQRGKGGWGRS